MRYIGLVSLCGFSIALNCLLGWVNHLSAQDQQIDEFRLVVNVPKIIDFVESNHEHLSPFIDGMIPIDFNEENSLDDLVGSGNEILGLDLNSEVLALELRFHTPSHLTENPVSPDSGRDDRDYGTGVYAVGDSIFVMPSYAVLHTAKQGNLSGLLMMHPEYQSQESESGTLHMVPIPDYETPAFVKFFENQLGAFAIAAVDPEELDRALERDFEIPIIDAANKDQLLRVEIDEKTFIQFRSEFRDSDNPVSNILQNMLAGIRSAELAVSSNGPGIKLTMACRSDSDEKMEQLKQAILGGKAILKMFVQRDSDESNEVKTLTKILDTMKVELTEGVLRIEIALNSVEELAQMLSHL